MKLQLADDEDITIEVIPGGETGYLTEVVVKSEGAVLVELLLRPEEWAALDAAIRHFQEEYWEDRRVDH